MSNTHNDVAHSWANKTGRHQRGFNLFYDNDTIYSYGYHFGIARHAKNASGEDCILFTSRGYSVSTAKHKTIVSRAIPDRAIVYHVFNVKADTKALHQENYLKMVRERDITLDKASRARSNKPYLLRSAAYMTETANSYSKAFKLGNRMLKLPDDIKTLLEQARKEQIAREKAQAERDRLSIRKWLDGETDQAPHTRTPYVRVKDNQVQTSWGVKVPLNRALALYRLSTHCKACNHAYKPRKRQIIGGWQIDQITEEGTLKVGCHIIPWRVQHEAAKLANLARAK